MLFGSKSTTDDTDYIGRDATDYIMEAVMLDGLSHEELQAFTESYSDTSSAVTENILLEKTIVKLDKHAKLSRAYKTAIFTIAKEKKDPKFKKLLTVWKMERMLEAALEKKYGSEAMRRARVTVKNSGKKSSSNLVKRAAANVSKQLNGEQKLK